MRTGASATVAMLLLASTPGFAHRLDEYLQAALLSVEKNQVRAQLRLTPGVAVLPAVLAGIDADADGVLSAAERSDYVERVLRDLSLSMDGSPLRLTVVSAEFPKTEEMSEGLGEIRIEFRAEMPRGSSRRRLVFENRHRHGIAAYLVNALVPADPDIRLGAQDRSQDQSVYRLDYVQAGVPSFRWSGAHVLAGGATLLLLARLVAIRYRTNL